MRCCCCLRRRRPAEVHGAPADVEQSASLQPILASVTADGQPAPRYKLTPHATADLERIGGLQPAAVRREPTPQYAHVTLGDATPLPTSGVASGMTSPRRPTTTRQTLRSSLSAAYDALDEPLHDRSPVVVALDATDETPRLREQSSIYFKYGTQESLDTPIESRDEEPLGPLPELLSPRGAEASAAGGPLPLAAEDSFGSAISGWAPGERHAAFEDAKTVEEQAHEERKRAGSLHDDEFLESDFHDAAESLPASSGAP